jgi:hypothetical protein
MFGLQRIIYRIVKEKVGKKFDSLIATNSESGNYQQVSSLNDISSNLEGNFTSLIDDVNTRIVYINLFNEK